MTLQDLVQLLQQQSSTASHQITLDNAALGRTDLDDLIKQQLQRTEGNIIVVVNPNDIPTNPPANGFSLSGFLPPNSVDSFLNLTNKNVTMNFASNGTAIDLILDVTLTKENNQPVSWSFGTSFSDMPGSVLDSLDLSDPHFILATLTGPYKQNSKLGLSVGLNFYSPLSLTGPLDAVATLISKNPVQLSDGRSATTLLPGVADGTPLYLFGPITPPATSDNQGGPTFDLHADLGIPSLSIGNVLALESLFVGTRHLYTADSPPQSVTIIYMGAIVKIQNSIGTQVNLDVYALLSWQSGSLTMTMLLLPHSPTDTSIANLGQLVAGNSWNAMFSGPAHDLLSYLDTFALKSFSTVIGLSNLSILSISLTAGIIKPWKFFNGYFTINTFDVGWLVLSPTKNATMVATLTTEFQLFNDPNLTFDLEIVVPNLTISGQYKGTINFTLAELLNEVGTFFGFSLSVPNNLATFQFSALSLYIDEPNGTFTFSGGAQVALNLFGIELLGLQNANFSVTVNSKGKLQVASMDGILTILGIDFAVNATIADKVVFEINLVDLTFGKLLSYLVNLVDPELDFTLDSPWDVLNSINLSSLKLEVNVTDGIVNVQYPIELQLGFIEINSFELTYTKKTGIAGVKIALECTFLGISYGQGNPLAWDALNEAPPAVPGKDSSLFDLEYLGLGQHIALVDTNGKPQQLDTVSAFIDALQSTVIPSDGDGTNDPTKLPGLAFDPNSGWLIGTRFTVIDTVSLSIIFNDPVVYGILIGLSGEKAKIFAGLSFEILYRKVTDTIGVYHTELKLPDYMRHLEFGEVSVTLPVVALDIYTNGDFKIDIGFPTNGDFSRSFAVEAFPFTGAGGFYFAKLSAATATDLPQIINGSFNPVIEFGIGLRIGLGKDISEGVFSAGISIMVQGIFEGTIAWFNPNDVGTPKDTYYKIQGVFAIIGHIYGSIDLEVVQASVDFEVYAGVKAVVEAYQPILIDLVASVSVSVSLKILFIRVSFSFSATIRQHFVLGSASPTPWQLGPAPTPQLRAFARTSRMQILTALQMTEDELFAEVRLVHITPTNNPNWQPLQVWATPKTLNLHFHPVFTYGLASDDLNDPARPAPGANDYDVCKGLILLFIQNSPLLSNVAPASNPAPVPFNILMQTLLAWTIQAYDQAAPLTSTTPLPTCDQANNADTQFGTYVTNTDIDLESLHSIYEWLTTPGQNGKVSFSHQDLVDLFAQNFCFNLMPPPATEPSSATEISMSVFPMFPEMTLTIPGKASGTTVTVDFNLRNAVPKSYLTTMQAYFNQLKVDYQNQLEKEAGNQVAANRAIRNASDSDSISMANFVFQDYFALLVRSAVQSALDYLNGQKNDSQPNPTMALEELLNDLATNNSFNSASGMVSRFLLHGLRLPEPTSLNSMLAADTTHLTQTHPLYAFTGQQFTVYNKPAVGDTYTIKLQSSAPLSWLKFTVAGQAAGELNYQLTSSDLSLLNKLSLGELKAVLSKMSIDRLVLYRLDNRRYNFQHRTIWNTTTLPALMAGKADGSVPTLWDFPDSLLTQLADISAVDPTTSLSLKLFKGMPDPSVTTGLNTTSLQAYAWATMIDMRVQYVPNLAANGELTNTYNMIGTDEVGRGYLEALWNYMTQLQASGQTSLIPHLYVLYQPQAGGGSTQALLNQDPKQALLLKTNLSTESHSQRNFSLVAMLLAAVASTSQNTYAADIGGLATQTVATNLDFIKLLWECSVVNTGGYYFNYLGTDGTSGLPDYLFSDGKTALLNLLIVLEPASSTSLTPTQLAELQVQVRNFHNTVVLEESLNTDQYLLFAATTDPALRVKVPTVGPGNVGFVSSRQATNDDYTLSGLYHLLSYTITAQANLFKPSNAGLPVGPADSVNDTLPDPNAGSVWNYRRIVPYAKFALQNDVQDVVGLPPASSNPYAGISGSGKVQMQLAVGVNDIYGNTVQESQLNSPSLEVGYTDTVISPAEWPSVAGTYYFEPKDTTTARLWALLHLNTAQYMPDQGRSLYASMSQAAGDLAKYTQIYYQVSQQDVTFSISTSVVTLTNSSLDKSRFMGYISTIYRYLSSVTQLQVPLLDLKTTTSLVVADLANVYHVNAAAFATENSSIANLFAPNTQLQVPGYYKVQFGDSWQSIALASEPTAKTDAAKLAAKLSDLATRNQAANPLLQPGTIIPIGTTTYTATGSELLADIVAKHTYVTSGDLARINPSAPLNQSVQLTLRGAQVTTQPHDTLTALVNRYNSTNNLTSTNQLTAYEVGATNPTVNLFAAGPLTVPINHQIGAADTLANIVSLYQKDNASLTVTRLVSSLQTNTTWLQSGARMCVEALPLVSDDGDTFDVLTNLANDAIRTRNKSSAPLPYLPITATDLATFNTNLGLYPQMGPDVNHLQRGTSVLPAIPYQLSVNSTSPSVYRLKVGDKLNTVANNDSDYAVDVVTANKVVPSILAPGATVTLGGISLTISQHDTFQTLLDNFNTQLKQSYCIKPATLESLRALGMPAPSRLALATVTGVFVNPADFLAAVQTVIGGDQTTTYRVALLELARQFGATLFVLSDLAIAVFNTDGLFNSGQLILLPPPTLKIEVDFTPNATSYNPGTIFPVTVEITIQRNPALVSSDFQDVATVSSATAELVARPLITSNASTSAGQPTSLRQFAQSFQATLSELKLATGTATKNIHSDIEVASRTPHMALEETGDGQSQQPRRLWAVKTGMAGFVYHVVQNKAYYFAPAPLSKSLTSGQVPVQSYQSGSGLQSGSTQTFSNIDLDSWAQTFLSAIDRFLDANFAVPAFILTAQTSGSAPKTAAQLVQDVLDSKQQLATAIAGKVTNVLDYGSEDVTYQRSQAAEALTEALLINLSSAYSTDAICVVPVVVEQSPYSQVHKDVAPRLSGKPTVVEQNQVSSEYSLSTAKVPLYRPAPTQPQPPYLTFLFSTKSPSTNKDISLNLTYSVNELEFNVQNLSGIANYQASSWLSFILPLNDDPSSELYKIGTLDIPIALRVSPLPPSLVEQQVISQETVGADLAAVRTWSYQYTYEHLNAMQDSIYTDVLYNVVPQNSITPQVNSAVGGTQNLFNTLADFITNYPAIQADLNLLPYLPANAAATVKTTMVNAIAAFSQLVSNVAAAWSSLNASLLRLALTEASLQYEYLIAETSDKAGDLRLSLEYKGQSAPAPLPLPDVAAVGYKLVSNTDPNQPSMTYTFAPDGTSVVVPQRTISIHNRDVVINWQNAWGGVWLTRNEGLVSQYPTNPAFVYRTAEIRFNSPALPLLRDNQLRNVALIGGTGQGRTLLEHIKAVFTTLFPVAVTHNIKLACTYGFNVVAPASDSSDSPLTAIVPVLLYHQLTDLSNDTFYQQVAGWLDGWQSSNPLPAENLNSFYLFDVTLFSNLGVDANDNQPEHVLLEVSNLKLDFKDIGNTSRVTLCASL